MRLDDHAGLPDTYALADFLARFPPFDTLSEEARTLLASAASLDAFVTGEVILDAFRTPSVEVFVVFEGQVELWNDSDRHGHEPDEVLDPGGVFGFSAMLSERTVGPRAVALDDAVVVRIPGEVASTAFASPEGAKFLAECMATARPPRATATFTTVDELMETDPLVVGPDASIHDVARQMTARDRGYAVVARGAGDHALVTDASLRAHVIGGDVSSDAPVTAALTPVVALAEVGESAGEMLIRLLESGCNYGLVLDDARLRGVVTLRSFSLSPTTADVSLHQRITFADNVTQLIDRARDTPDLLTDLLHHGMASGRVIAVYSALIDTVARRAIELTFADRPELPARAFTWLSLGSNGRRESVLSSDVDAAVAFADDTPDGRLDAYREAFAAVHDVLNRAGLSSDGHGAIASRPAFSRTNAQWRTAAHQWLDDPVGNQGAIMTSLLVDGRPVFGDDALPAVAAVFRDLRSHPGTMRLLLQESLSRRAKLRPIRDSLMRRAAPFDIKDQALLPVVNLARWAALSVGSADLPTVDRLRAAAGSEILPEAQARTLVEVFEVLQRLRLRYQLMQFRSGENVSDLMQVNAISPIDRSVIVQAVHEIQAVQKRMSTVSHYLDPEQWIAPQS
jgi:CBS domain-containing protein